MATNKEKLSAIAELIVQLQGIDKAILTIEKFADQVANDECKVQLHLNLINVTKQREMENKVTFDEDGSLERRFHSMTEDIHRRMLGIGMHLYPPSLRLPQPGDEDNTYKHEINETVTLKVLGIMLEEKLSERTRILGKLAAYNLV
jgi:hypothetical protein